MGKVIFDISVSLDGYYTAPRSSAENQMGDGGMRLHDWAFDAKTQADEQILTEARETVGAVIAGRRTYDFNAGLADGWGKEDGPLGSVPTFVVSHSIPENVTNVFTFVTDGVENALHQAKSAANDKNVSVMSPNIAQQLLQAGLIDEIRLHLVPVLLGGGKQLFANIGTKLIELEQTQIIETPSATHLCYRIVK